MPTPVATAVKTQNLAGLKTALGKHDGPVPAQAVVAAAQLAWTPGLELLHKHGADFNASFKNYRPLHALIQERPHGEGSPAAGRVACLEWLLRHGADPERVAAWPAARALVIAAFAGEPLYVEALRKGGARIDVFTASALGESKTVRKLLAADATLSVARDGGLLTALQCCGGSRMGRNDNGVGKQLLKIARLLVDAGADVNVKTRSWGHDVDVAHFVVGSRQIEMLKMLLERGLDANAAVARAAWDGREDLVDLLLHHGARLDQAFEQERPVLNELVRWGQFKQARMLLARGASPNVADSRGWTAVHQAASRGNVKMMEDLLAAGGDRTRHDKSGATPLDVARVREIASLLKSASVSRRSRTRPR
jgi:ankyrin repeat protein